MTRKSRTLKQLEKLAEFSARRFTAAADCYQHGDTEYWRFWRDVFNLFNKQLNFDPTIGRYNSGLSFFKPADADRVRCKKDVFVRLSDKGIHIQTWLIPAGAEGSVLIALGGLFREDGCTLFVLFDGFSNSVPMRGKEIEYLASS